MTTRTIMSRARLGTALAALAIAVPTALAPVTPAAAQSASSYKPTRQLTLSTGEGQMISLSKSVTSVWTSNPDVADVYVNSPRQINIFGKKMGDATIIATARDGSLVYGAQVHVSQNLSSVNDMLRAAMPDSNITVTTVGQVAVINGTVASPDDAAQAETLVSSVLNPGIKPGDALNIVPLNRLRTATPLQVTLKVRIAEVNRDLLKSIGVNLLTGSGGIGISQGSGIFLPPPDDTTGLTPKILRSATGSTLSGVGKLFGMDILSSLDLAETDGLVTTLAEPNLTALSGETASFLAGGEFPIPVSQGGATAGAVTIEYKQFGVSLAFTPIVLADGRISMRVRPEVSELSDAGSVKLGGFTIPALTTRRAETTVELGSGQSFMLAGLLKNSNNNSIDKAPFLGDLPILGALFRSTKFRRQETELVIIVTPYLVRPVNGQMALPTNGYRAPSDAQQFLEGQTYTGVSGPAAVARAPAPVIGASPTTAAPGFKL